MSAWTAAAGLGAHATSGHQPPPLTPLRLLSEWVFEPVPAILIAVTAGLYVYGVHRLRARGDQWSRWRTFCFVGLGLGAAVLATQSALAAYDTVLISVHMVQHMLLNMVVPIFLALGAPITLALRTLPRTGRRRLLGVLHSRIARVLTFPLVAGAIFIANPFILYFSGLYEATLRHPVLHDLNHLHFVVIGCLWFWPLIGLDPMPYRAPYPLRMLGVFVTLPFHAFVGVAIMSATSVLAADWYLALNRDWGPGLLNDQQAAGGILWATGDLVGLIVFTVLFFQWASASEREAQREDRRLDRLARAAAADQRPPGAPAAGV
ncbi:MAG TPA: cytochrome c oxidase assembly protein [Actinomycetes bacterium]|nr:cytochrome c oxidase assembly protein [Actinomycetes bacterium]